MARSLFLLLISSFIGIVFNPYILMASDSVSITGLDDARIVETIPKPTPKPVIQETVYSTPVKTQVVVARVTTPSYTNSITVLGRTNQVYNVDTPAVDAGGHVNKFRKMYYGHNTSSVFGNLYNISNGTIISINLNGISSNYRVSSALVFEKASDTQLSLNGEIYSMGYLTNNAMGHSIMLMTCTGTSYGNGDASHRLVVFADEI